MEQAVTLKWNKRENVPMRRKNLTELFKAILALENNRECFSFFRDLLTEDEIREISKRWFVVRSIDKGLSYREISALSGLSLTTITRVGKWFQKGKGGYRLILQRLKEADRASDLSA